jgi:hypothetical protein
MIRPQNISVNPATTFSLSLAIVSALDDVMRVRRNGNSRRPCRRSSYAAGSLAELIIGAPRSPRKKFSDPLFPFLTPFCLVAFVLPRRKRPNPNRWREDRGTDARGCPRAGRREPRETFCGNGSTAAAPGCRPRWRWRRPRESLSVLRYEKHLKDFYCNITGAALKGRKNIAGR